MKTILINITTCDDNYDYFEKCLNRLFNNDTEHRLIILVTDYGLDFGQVRILCDDFEDLS